MLKKLMVMMAVYYFLQGMGGNPGLHAQAFQKFLKEVWGFGPAAAAAFMAILIIPWSIKPLYGMLSDFLPIFGWRRKSYFILTGIVATAAYGMLSVLYPSYAVVLSVLFVAAVCFAFSDVLCDAVMVEKGQLLNCTDRLQSVQWTAIGVSGVIIAFSKGYIAQYLSLQQAVLLSAIFPVIMIVFTIFMLKEPKVESSKEAAKQAWSGLKIAAKTPLLWTTALFLFLFNCQPNLGTAFYYYEKDVLKFSDVLIGHIDTVSSVVWVLGTLLYGVIAKRLSHKGLLKTVILTSFVTTLAYLFFKDKTSAFIITAGTSLVGPIAFLGLLTVAAKACPKHAEGVVFALLMSVLNFGGRIGGVIGGKLYEKMGYSPLILLTAGLVLLMWFLLPLIKEPPKASAQEPPKEPIS